MKKVLVTGGAGTIGLQVIKFLLSEGKYKVSVLELKCKRTYKRLRKYRKRIDILFGDINDVGTIDHLVKTHDIVIHLAEIVPPFADVNENLSRIVNYEGTMNIVNAIRDYNPKCYLVYGSSTSVYGKVSGEECKRITIKNKPNISEFDFYAKHKIQSEEYIRGNIKNYTILRNSYVLCDVKHETTIYNVPKDLMIEAISAEDAGYAYVKCIDYRKELNRKTYNLSGGPNYYINFTDYLIEVLKNYGLSFRYLSARYLADKNFYGGFYSDGDDLEAIINFRSKDIKLYYDILELYRGKISRLIPRILAIPFILGLRKKNKEK